jgi:hypothetical protein
MIHQGQSGPAAPLQTVSPLAMMRPVDATPMKGATRNGEVQPEDDAKAAADPEQTAAPPEAAQEAVEDCVTMVG